MQNPASSKNQFDSQVIDWIQNFSRAYKKISAIVILKSC